MTRLLIYKRLPSHYRLFQVVVKADDSSFRAAGLCTKYSGWFTGLPIFLSLEFRGHDFWAWLTQRSWSYLANSKKDFSKGLMGRKRCANHVFKQRGFQVKMKPGCHTEERIFSCLLKPCFLNLKVKNQRWESLAYIVRRIIFSWCPGQI